MNKWTLAFTTRRKTESRMFFFAAAAAQIQQAETSLLSVTPQGWLDDVNQRLLARTACRLLPLLPHHSPVHRSRNRHGGHRSCEAGSSWTEHFRLGSLVLEDEGLRLHVHGLRAPEGLWHHQLLDIHLLYHTRDRRVLHSSRQGLEGGQKGSEGPGQKRGGEESKWEWKKWGESRLNGNRRELCQMIFCDMCRWELFEFDECYFYSMNGVLGVKAWTDWPHVCFCLYCMSFDFRQGQVFHWTVILLSMRLIWLSISNKPVFVHLCWEHRWMMMMMSLSSLLSWIFSLSFSSHGLFVVWEWFSNVFIVRKKVIKS